MKGIIVVDIQDDCTKCILYSHSFGCRIKMKKYMLKGKPDWCPIKPMPEKREPKEHPVSHRGIFMEGFETGWNDCIDKILKGENIEEKEK